VTGRGFPPGDPEKRARPNSAQAITDLPAARAPVRPPRLPASYGKAVRAWWRTWLGSPQAAMFAATDWQRLLMLAPLVEEYAAAPTTGLLAEIRLNEAKFGATPEDRQRLRWRVPPGTAAPAEAAAAAPARERGDPRLQVVQGGQP